MDVSGAATTSANGDTVDAARMEGGMQEGETGKQKGKNGDIPWEMFWYDRLTVFFFGSLGSG